MNFVNHLPIVLKDDMMKLSIIVPTFKKPESLKRLVKSIKQCTSRDLTELIIVVDDEDGHEWIQDEMDCRIEYCGNCTGAVMATWKGVLVSGGWHVGVLGDDTELITPKIDELIIDSLHGCRDIVVGLNDGFEEGRKHPFMPKSHWINGCGFPPCYRHSYADVEIYLTAKHHNKWRFLKEAVIKHHNPLMALKGFDVDVIEENINESTSLSKNGMETLERRMKWWRENNNPRMIPWNI